MRRVEVDHLVVGAGAMGMAFVDALIDHADVEVILVDRRARPGGHWVDAYPFVQLHQASLFYGVVSSELGDGTLQTAGPEVGLHQRATVPEILAYYDQVLARLQATGRLRFLAGAEHHADGPIQLVTTADGEQIEVRTRRPPVDATYLSPTIPAATRPPWRVTDERHVVTPNDLPAAATESGSFVVVGSGKTATDSIIWLLQQGVDPDRIAWVRPREPWMLNRAVVQPDTEITAGLAADLMESAARASSPDELFLRLEACGVMFRVDPEVLPTMARTPTLARWELDLLRTIDRVVRRGHVQESSRSTLVFDDGVVSLPGDTLVVHCAASGTVSPPLVPIWQRDAIRLQTVRAGAPCFNAALIGYVEATRQDDVERNRLCPPNLYGNSLAQWCAMQSRGSVAVERFTAEPDIAAWANGTALNPSRLDPNRLGSPAARAAVQRLDEHMAAGRRRLAEFAGP